MAIILDTKNWDQKTDVGFLQRTLYFALTDRWPQKKFLFPISAAAPVIAFPQCVQWVSFPPTKGLLSRVKMQKWLRDQNTTLFISFDRTVKKGAVLKQMRIFSSEKNWNEKSVKNADFLGFVSNGLLQQFTQKFPDHSSKCFLLQHLVPDINATVVAGNAQVLKETFSNGVEYFITSDFDFDKEKLITLLKGFSIFKQMQQSSWKLMVVLPDAENPAQKAIAEQLLQHYKYRSDVVLTNDTQLIEKIAASYLLISQCQNDHYPIPIALAAKAHRPVIANNSPMAQLILGDAAMYLRGNSSQAIGEALMQMYKDEKIHANYTKKMKEIAPTINIETALNKLAQIAGL